MNKIIPVYFSKKEKLIKPGVVISSDPIEIAAEVHLDEETSKIQCSIRTCSKGLPHDITLDEANFRMFCGKDSLKELYKSGTYSKQYEVLQNICKNQDLQSPFKWCRSYFWGLDPVIVLKRDEEFSLLLLDCSIKKTGSFGQILSVHNEDLEEVSSEEVFRYYFCRDSVVLSYIKKHPDASFAEIDNLTSSVFETIINVHN